MRPRLTSSSPPLEASSLQSAWFTQSALRDGPVKSCSMQKIRSGKALAWLALIAGGTTSLAPASAQSVGPMIHEPADVPGNRLIPEYDPIGYDWSGFEVFPSVTLGAKADSNVFARDDVKRSDVVLRVEPRLHVKRENRSTDIILDASARTNNYLSLTDQDATEYRVEGKFTYGTMGPNSISLDAGYRREVVQRGTVESDLAEGEPSIRRVLFGSITGRKQFNRLSLDAQVIGMTLRYNDIMDGSGGRIEQRFRNGERWGVQGTATYELSGRTALIAGATFDRYDYRASPLLENRDADNLTGTLGLRYEISRLLYAQLGVGTRHYDFRDPTLRDLNGLAISGHLRYFPSRLLAIRAKIEQINTTSPYDLIGAVTLTTAQIEAEYEMRRSLSWLGSALFQVEDYGKQPYSGRRFEISGGLRLRFNRWLRTDGAAGFAKRTVQGPAPFQPFTQFYGMISLTLAR